MKVLVSGSSGLIGWALVPFLMKGGHEVVRLTRSAPKSDVTEVRWDISSGQLDASRIEGFDAVVHLAGENIAAGRWTKERRQRIRESRVKGTRLLCETLARLGNPPKVLVCASAIGYYGDRGSEFLTEESCPGNGFLADLVREWEMATEAAFQKGIRIVKLRFGVVLTPNGGALARLLPVFRLGLGGVLGSGNQYVSWIAREDAVGAIGHAIATDALQGPVNAVAPNSVTNRQFTKALGKVLGRPTLFRVPASVLRAVFGQMADETLLASTRVKPLKLTESGYAFRHLELEAALRGLL